MEYPGAAFRIESRGPSGKSSRIDPSLKAWLDNVLVPAMVRLYLAKNECSEDNGSIPTTERVQ